MSSYRYSKVISCALYGISGVKVEIEVSILPGLTSFEIVGLGDSAIRESRDRVHAAIKNNGFIFPNGRITVGMAPGFIRKEGTAFDLPIGIAILAASNQIKQVDETVCITGEMSLSGEIRSIPGSINRILTARDEGITKIIIPYYNLSEGEGINDIDIYGVRTFIETIDLIESEYPWDKQIILSIEDKNDNNIFRDISSIVGQPLAVRALTIAAAGKHNLLMAGSPGCGKTTLAKILPGILPDLTLNEKIEVTKIYSSCGLLKSGNSILNQRPFRAPHHNATLSAITGGGAYPAPGEITLAHKGVLFLDEMNEFSSNILDMLRQPLEDKKIRISRCKYTMEYPADFILIGATNPCRCGNLLERDNRNPCTCSKQAIEKYFSNISGPILDRIDLYVELTKVSANCLNGSITENTERISPEIKSKVLNAWEIQFERCIKHNVSPELNSRISSVNIMQVFELSSDVLKFAVNASEKLDLSVRGYQKMLRIARTIADYDGDEIVSEKHIAQALQFRKK